MENSPLTNAGYGSNLNEDGCVEQDASLMVSEKNGERSVQFGAVSAIKCIQNPIIVAKEIVKYQNEPNMIGRVPPW